jgi:hypothetical protein
MLKEIKKILSGGIITNKNQDDIGYDKKNFSGEPVKTQFELENEYTNIKISSNDEIKNHLKSLISVAVIDNWVQKNLTIAEQTVALMQDIADAKMGKPQTGGKNKKSKKVVKKIARKHRGIVQIGGNKGRLRKGYKFSGKKLKSGLPQIIKCVIKI